MRPTAVPAAHRPTALVGANDTVALACLDWCASRRIGVPRQMSVVGFDDSEDAAAADLTSYGFRPADSIAALVRFVTDRRRYRRLAGEGMGAMGALTVRDSSAKPPQDR